MNRLTEYRKDLKRYEYKQDERGYCFIQEGQIVNKLGKLEDIEEQIGCPLEVFFKVIATKKVYIVLTKCNFNRVYFVNLDFSAQDILTLGFFVGGCKFLFNEYKITWWLKEDKSE